MDLQFSFVDKLIRTVTVHLYANIYISYSYVLVIKPYIKCNQMWYFKNLSWINLAHRKPGSSIFKYAMCEHIIHVNLSWSNWLRLLASKHGPRCAAPYRLAHARAHARARVHARAHARATNRSTLYYLTALKSHAHGRSWWWLTVFLFDKTCVKR